MGPGTPTKHVHRTETAREVRATLSVAGDVEKEMVKAVTETAQKLRDTGEELLNKRVPPAESAFTGWLGEAHKLAAGALENLYNGSVSLGSPNSRMQGVSDLSLCDMQSRHGLGQIAKCQNLLKNPVYNQCDFGGNRDNLASLCSTLREGFEQLHQGLTHALSGDQGLAQGAVAFAIETLSPTHRGVVQRVTPN